MDSPTCLLYVDSALRSLPWCIPLGREWLMQLFSGTAGAIIGGIVAAAAALFVLNRTNLKQQELWDASNAAQDQRDRETRAAQITSEGAARILQENRDQEAREAQRATLNKQLEAQQKSLEKQLEAQAASVEAMHVRQVERAATERQMEAVAAFTDTLLRLRLAVNIGEPDVLARTTESTHALVRWSLDLYGKHESFREELFHWQTALANDARALRNLRDQSSGSEDRQRNYNKLMDQYESRVGFFINTFGRWLAEPSRKAHFLDALKTNRPDSMASVIHKELGVNMPWFTGENM